MRSKSYEYIRALMNQRTNIASHAVVMFLMSLVVMLNWKAHVDFISSL